MFINFFSKGKIIIIILLAGILSFVFFGRNFWRFDKNFKKNSKENVSLERQPKSSGKGDLGQGVIESVYPSPGQRIVPRNTAIAITFKEPMDIQSFRHNLQIAETDGKPVIRIKAKGQDKYIQAKIKTAFEGKVVVLEPVSLLGSTSTVEWYTVELTDNIYKANGKKAFKNNFQWNFEVGNFVDKTPPYVFSHFPSYGSSPRNVVIQISFSEAINPIAVSYINVINNAGVPIKGRWEVSNQYRTIEFLGTECQTTNSCGDPVFCLPSNETIKIIVPSLEKESDLKNKDTVFDFYGFADMAGNPLDGNRNKIIEGVEHDNYFFSFATNDELNLSAPQAPTIKNNQEKTKNNFNGFLEIKFSELMMHSSLGKEGVKISPQVDYWITAVNLPFSDPAETWLKINYSNSDPDILYTSKITSKVKNLYQECLKDKAKEE